MNMRRWILALVFAGLAAGHGFVLEPLPAMAASHVADAACGHEKIAPGWSDENRAKWYHCDQGTALIPYDWFRAMEMIDTNNLFIDTLKLFKLIPDVPDETLNPHGLPVGFSIIELDKDPLMGKPFYKRDEATDMPIPLTVPDKATGQHAVARDQNNQPLYMTETRKWVGVNCAFCHTGQIGYRDKRNRLQTLVIDGAPTMQNNLAFTKALFASVAYTLGFGHTQDPQKRKAEINAQTLDTCVNGTNNNELLAFAARLGHAARLKTLREDLCAFLVPRLALNQLATAVYGDADALYPVEWGHGRMDAFGRAGNSILLKLDRGNLRKMGAPISIPHIWGAFNYDWFQWNGSVGISLARSIGESIGVGAPARLSSGPSTPPAFQIKVANLMGLEALRQEVPTPLWPGVFPPLDEARVKRGAKLYAEKCLGCHGMITEPGERKYSMRLIPLHVIGTDPTHARNYNQLEAYTGPLEPMMGKKASAKEIIKYLVDQPMADPGNKDKIIKRYGIDFSLYDENEWHAPLAYIARPNNGIWATAPFLHNGSVPNLYELLSPVGQRSKTFCVGTLEFDPVKVGYKTDCGIVEKPLNTAFPIDNQDGTKATPNSNVGHEFRNTEGCEKLSKTITEGLSLLDKDTGRRDRIRKMIFGGDEKAVEKAVPWEQPGILGCEIPETDRWDLVEFLKSSQDEYLKKIQSTRDRATGAMAVPDSRELDITMSAEPRVYGHR